MKKITSLFLTILMVLSIITMIGCSDSTTTNQGSGTAASNTEADGKLGDYSVVIDSCRLAKDYENKDVVIVKYKFSNVSSSSPASFFVTITDNVYQGGVGLNKAYVLDENVNYSEDNQTKEIKQGASIDVEIAYELNDTTTDIEVEVAETFSFSDSKVVKTFKIAQ